MKKIFIFILVFLALFIVSCKDDGYIDDPNEDGLYENISSVKYDDFKEIYINFAEQDTFFTLRIPSVWEIIKDDSKYKITLNDKDIGVIYKGPAQDLDKWKNVYSSERRVEDLVSYRCIDKYGTGETLDFRHRLFFEYDDKEKGSFTIEIEYEEVDSLNLTMLQSRFNIRSIKTDPKMGYLNISSPDNILIIGNSFVNSSMIYSSLSSMMSNSWKQCNVDAISIGYATVKTYAEDEYIMSLIRSGNYDAVFVCGFYSDEELVHFRTILDACRSSETKAVVFPAHNESISVSKMASSFGENVFFLDWKGEIDTFIKNGMSKWDFCVKDGHSHSNELAGYIGAHMIYRALYGKCPDGSLTYPISQGYINKMLGDYAKTGIIVNLNLDDAIIL